MNGVARGIGQKQRNYVWDSLFPKETNIFLLLLSAIELEVPCLKKPKKYISPAYGHRPLVLPPPSDVPKHCMF